MGRCKGLVCCIVTFLLISIVGISANASNNSHESCVKEHFSYIQETSDGDDQYDTPQYPSNSIGTCPYVAISLLLSYYDAYWNDLFVPDDYETIGTIHQQTGDIWMDFHFTLENADWSKMVQDEGWDLDNEEDFAEASEAYARFIEDNADKYFQLYLISLAIDEGFHDGEEAYGLDDSETVDFLEFYLYDICGFNSNQITVQLLTENLVVNTNEDLIDTAIQLIESGTPVIYGGYNFNINNNRSHELVSPSIGGHYLFGYDVVEGEDDIVLSKCWNGKDTTTFRTTEYNYLSSIIWLEINEDAFPHVCSSSYDSPINDEEFCVCEIYSQHPNHTHQLYTGLESCPMASFVSRCQCGKAMNWTHKYDTAGYSSTEHWDECVCGDKEHVESHDFVYQQLSNTHHSVTCECGYEGEVMHVFTYTSMSNSVHTGTCACGYSIAEEHNLERVSPRYSVCTQCRYTRDHHLGGNENVHLGIKKEDEND